MSPKQLGPESKSIQVQMGRGARVPGYHLSNLGQFKYQVNLSIKKNNDSSYDTLDRNKSKSTVILNNKRVYKGGVALLHRIPGNAYRRKDQRRKITLQCNHGHRQGPSMEAKTMLK